MNVSVRSVPPRAGALLETLRGLGYSTGAALADIIDNSIAAQASEVDICFFWKGADSCVTVLDNGRGMDDRELERAMRLGDKSPLEERAPGDLGRFGMGLKTASFSQCRRLTVASKKSGVTSCLRWDLDALAADETGGWLLFEGLASGSESLLEPLEGLQSGTVVIWELLDRIVTSGFTANDFGDVLDRVETHLAMVFHRLLEGPAPRFVLRLNGRPVKPWDPFLTGHIKPWVSPVARSLTASGAIEIECHVLPHRDQLSEATYNDASGPEGWTAQQGFYVYRNKRLLVSGGWLGLGPSRAWNREEAYRLARIRLDIPNSADAAWKIDIRKSVARPPVSLRPWLTRFAEDTRERARRVFAYRGSPTAGTGGAEIEQAWKVERRANGMQYRIDESHPAVAAVLDGSGEQLPLVRAMLRVIEETVPVQRIWLDTAENKDTPQTAFKGRPSAEVIEVLRTLFADMTGRRGMSPEVARRTLLATEPFQNYPDLVAALPGSGVDVNSKVDGSNHG